MPVNTITKTKTGYRYRRDKYDIKSKQGETRKEFSLRCDEIDSLIDARGTGGASMTLDQLFTRWMEDYVKINLSPASARIMQPIYDQYIKPYHGHRLLHEITRADVYQRLAEIYRDKPLSGSMLTKLRGCYSRPYRWAMHALDLNIDVPTNGLIFKIPKSADKPETRSRIITDQEWQVFQVHAQGSKYLKYYQLLYMTGLRPSECLGLQVRDIKSDRLEIRRAVTRDGKSGGKNQAAIRDIPMTNEMRSLLSDHSASVAFHTPQGWLWSTREGTPDMYAIKSSMARIQRSSGLQISLYDFRHTFATRMVELGMQPTVLQHILGHTQITTTLQYYPEMSPNLFDQARELMGNGKNTGNAETQEKEKTAETL